MPPVSEHKIWLKSTSREPTPAKCWQRLVLRINTTGSGGSESSSTAGFRQPARTDRRAWEWYYLKSLAHRDIATLEGQGWHNIETTWGPRSKAVLMVSSDGRVDSFDVATGQVKTLATFSVPMRRAVWGRDLTLLAAACADGKIRVWSMATKKLLAEVTCRQCEGYGVELQRPMARGDQRIRRRRLSGIGRNARSSVVSTMSIISAARTIVSWHPQKPLLATISRTGEIVVIDVESGESATPA